MIKVLEKETYESVKAMLESPDQESVVLGMECLKNTDLSKNITYLLFLIKETNLKPSDWRELAPEIYTKILNILYTYRAKVLRNNTPTGIINHEDILAVMKIYNVPNEDYQFFADRFSQTLAKMLKKETIKDIKITINFEHESRPISQDLERSDA